MFNFSIFGLGWFNNYYYISLLEIEMEQYHGHLLYFACDMGCWKWDILFVKSIMDYWREG